MSKNIQGDFRIYISVPLKIKETLLKKRLRHRRLPVNSAKFLRTLFLTEHLWATASKIRNFDKAFLLSFYHKN